MRRSCDAPAYSLLPVVLHRTWKPVENTRARLHVRTPKHVKLPRVRFSSLQAAHLHDEYARDLRRRRALTCLCAPEPLSTQARTHARCGAVMEQAKNCSHSVTLNQRRPLLFAPRLRENRTGGA